MTVINEHILHRRHILLLVLIGIFVISVVAVTISLLIVSPASGVEDEYSGQKNVLFIVVDDLRPALGCYGDKKAITPNIDQLASKGIVFKNAYAQQALCAPSRTSFLTSRRPDSLHLYDTGSYWRESVGNFVTLPQHFKYHGYETISVGKIFHHGIVSNKTDDYPISWTEYPYRPSTMKDKMMAVCPTPDGERMNLICPVDIETQDEKTLPDIQNTDYAIQYLMNKTKGPNKNVPFFLGVGYYKPHIPFKFPKEYLDLYPIDSMDLAPNNTKPKNMPKISWNPWMDIRERDDVKELNISIPYGPVPDDFQREIRQGYYASLSYMDDQLGRLLKALEDSGYADHTTIVLLGDHGWSLGEHQEWSKYSNFEVSLKVPLIVYIPELMDEDKKRVPFHHNKVLEYVPTNKSGSAESSMLASKYTPKYQTEELVELVDLFPTLAEIAEIAVPPLCRVYSTTFCSEGLSFYPLIEHLVTDPWIDFNWKTATFSQYPRPSLSPKNNSDQPALKDIRYMGYSIRTTRFRYTEWVKFDKEKFKPDWPTIISRELYDHKQDPQEMNNVSDQDEYANLVIELSKKIKKGWRHAMPPGLFDGPLKHFHNEVNS
ncbi:iduronate 2-sulfatase-like [Argiope bruennichi]|uniref:iduronate 2-sulfatase-like n=1 Tax=Argiope bruennichi TaxID=94029 RepID=UPI002493F5C3|nr:iduronate 2-sulfatase-like [Argiope bruennichi]